MNQPNGLNANLSIKSPCVGLCSTTYGDLVCLGCKRFTSEVTDWITLGDEQKIAIWQRLQLIIVPIIATYFTITDKNKLQDYLQRKCINYYPEIKENYMLWILLRKQLDSIDCNDLSKYGFALNTNYQTYSNKAKNIKLIWSAIEDRFYKESSEQLAKQ